jgi:hypothetical protein
MDLLLLVGSGISYASGMPGVDEMTDAVLNGKWFQHTDETFISGLPYVARVNDPTSFVQEFLRRLKPEADRSHPLSGRSGNYEDLYFLAEQIAENAQGQIDNPAILPFVEALAKQNKELTDSLHNSLGKLAELACDFIRCVVWNLLSASKSIRGLDLIESLARAAAIQRLDIVTLNHDLVIERFLAEKQLPFVDGFTDPEGDVRYFDPARFESVSKVRLFKMHGSINWFRFRATEGDVLSDRMGIVSGTKPDHAKDRNGRPLLRVDVIPQILAGTHLKATQYGFGIYAEMHFWFHRLLRQHRIIAMSGYGWGDRGINGRLMEWLHSPEDRSLVLMDQKMEDLVSFSRSPLWHRYGPLVEAGRIIPIKKWMQDVSFDEVWGRLMPTGIPL